MAGPVNKEINVNINALVKKIQDVREFVALIRSLREQRGTAPVIVDEKISRNARASISEVDRLTTSIEELREAISRIDEHRFSRLAAAFSVVGTVYSAVTNVPAFVEGVKTLKDLGGKGPAIASGISSIANGARDLLQTTRQKIGDGLTKAKETVTGLVDKLPGVIRNGTAAAGTLGTLGVAGSIAAAGLGALVAVIGALVAAILAVVGAVAVFSFLFNLSKGAAEAGSEIHDLTQELAVSAEVLSALKVATATTSTSFDEAAKFVSKFNKQIGEAADGSKEATEDLKRLGIEPQEAFKNNEAALAKVFQRIHELPTPLEKARAAQLAFKKGGEAMVPVIESVGGSLEKAKERAAEFGQLLNDKAAKEADEFGDQLDELKLRVNGLGLALGRNLIPELLKLLRVLAHEMPGAGSAFSFLFALITAEVQKLVNIVITAIAALKTLAALPSALAVLIGTGNLETAFNVILDRFRQERDELLKVGNTATAEDPTKGPPLDPAAQKDKKKATSTFEAEAQARRAAAQTEFNLEKDFLDRIEAIYRTALDNRKIATDDYYDALEGFRRRELKAQLKLNDELQKIERDRRDAEIKEIEKDTDSTPLQKANQKINVEARFQATIAPLEEEFKKLVRAAGDLPREIATAETAALEELDRQVSAFLAKVDEANGRTAAAAAEAIDEEFRGLLEKLTIEQGENSPLVKLIKEFIQLQKDRARVKQIDEQLQPLGQQFEIDRLEIETRISKEQITQKQGRRELIELQRQYLQAQLAILKNELAATQEARAQLEIKLRIAQIQKQLADLKEIDETARSINENLRFAFEDFFASIADGTKSIKESFADLGRFILQMFARLAAQKLVESLFGNLFGDSDGQGGIGGVLGGIFGGKKAAGDMMSARPGGQLIQVAEAGFDELVVTTDPRYAERTSGLLSEFIRRTGIFPNVEQFAAGGFARRIGASFTTSIPRLAAGAFVSAVGPETALAGIGASSGPSEFLIKQFNIYDPRHVHDAMRHDGGDAVFWNFIDHNATEIRQRLKVRS